MNLKQFIHSSSCSWALKSPKIFTLTNKVAMNIPVKSLLCTCPRFFI